MAETEVPISQELLAQVLGNISPETVLVGGQALAFWVSYYDVDLTPGALVGAISDDADFLGSREDVFGIARGTSGMAELTSPKVMSALVGQVKIPVGANEFVNIDVLHRLVGLEAGMVRKHASEVTLRGISFLVMHPLDVLQSRVENLARLKDKQNPEGIEQSRLAVKVAGRYIAEIAAEPSGGQRHALKMVEHVVTIAKSSAGRRAAKDFGVDLRGAVPLYAIHSEEFKARRYPQILKELAAVVDRPAASNGMSFGL